MQKKHAKLTGRRFSNRKRHSSYATSTVPGSPEETKLSLNRGKNFFANSVGGEDTVAVSDKDKLGHDTERCASKDDDVFANSAIVTEGANSPISEEANMTPNATEETKSNEGAHSGGEIWRYSPAKVNTLSPLPLERLHRNCSVRFNQQQEDKPSHQVVERLPANSSISQQDGNQIALQPAIVRHKQGFRRADHRSSATRLHSHRLSIKSFKDTSLFQNMKMAGMLFVVAIVYILTFIPAMLMASEIITLFLPIFYLYYVNNAVNPIIYCFMNPNFREDIRNFCKLRTCFLRRQRR
ncbi:unnamed protein product [Dibothriocephalus latus]|uniref:G-protein coupled receptors family 1 profile domain-containing protein n=1 Tax=Dibothriocephalus latus TaxID=60516 RepID=A0A3P6SCM1_DIBLA|nr:unnamed protein product [Dibothriocephalus latus]